jgi:hypothetical protein
LEQKTSGFAFRHLVAIAWLAQATPYLAGSILSPRDPPMAWHQAKRQPDFALSSCRTPGPLLHPTEFDIEDNLGGVYLFPSTEYLSILLDSLLGSQGISNRMQT